MRLSALLLTLFASLLGCDSDPFGVRRVTIVEPYELEQAEMGYFYLRGPEHQEGGYGILTGTVKKIGWRDNIIVVQQNGDGLGEGWRVIDAALTEVSPLLSESQIAAFPQTKSVKLETAEAVWTKLKGGDA